MHKKKTLQKVPESDWLKFLKKKQLKNLDEFETKDDQGAPVILEWHQSDIKSPKLAEFKQHVSVFASQILTPIEIQFLRAYPQAVTQELFLQSCAPFFEKGIENVDWKRVEEKIKSTIRQFFSMDLSKFGDEIIKPLLDDIYFFVSAKDKKSGKLLGFLMSSITPAQLYGNVKLINLAVLNKGRGLEAALLSCLFRTIPEIERLFLYVRPTNDNDLNILCTLGFRPGKNTVEDPHHKVNAEYLTLMEYTAANAKILQNAAHNLKGI